MAVKKAQTMADIFLCVHCVLDSQTPESILSILATSDAERRVFKEQRTMAADVMRSTTIIGNAASKASAVATIKMEECNSAKLLMAVCEAVISGKLPKEVKESLSSTTDGDKVALLTMLNSCKQAKDPNLAEIVKVAKTCAMKAKSYGEQALILEMVLRTEDEKTMKKRANKAAVDGTRQEVKILEPHRTNIQQMIEMLAGDKKSSLGQDHAMVCMDALPNITEGSQMVKLLGALLLGVSPMIIKKMSEAWAPKDQYGRPIRQSRLDSLTAMQKTSGLEVLRKCSWLAASDRIVAVQVVESCKHQATMLLLFLAILEGVPARGLKKLHKDITNMNVKVVPQDDVIEHEFRVRMLAMIERTKNGPIGAKRSAALRAMEKAERAGVALAVVAALIGGKSVYQIVGARALGSEAEVDDATKKAIKEEEEKEKNAINLEKEKKFGCIIHSTVHTNSQKAAGLVSLEKAKASPMRCEVLLSLLACRSTEDILNSVNKRGISRGFTKPEKENVLTIVEESTLWEDHKALATKLVNNATTKQELVIILEKAVVWLEHVTQDDRDKFVSFFFPLLFFFSSRKDRSSLTLFCISLSLLLLLLLLVLLLVLLLLPPSSLLPPPPTRQNQ